MPQYMMSYIAGNPPATPEEGKQHMARYREWLASLGDALSVSGYRWIARSV